MKLVGIFGTATILFIASLSPAAAASHQAASARFVQRTFHLQVTGTVDARATFWVAYGPLAGRFGVFQLRATGQGTYEASRSLPAQGQTIFVYLQGEGVVHTKFGAAPGNPVVTIKTVGPVSASSHALDVVAWHLVG